MLSAGAAFKQFRGASASRFAVAPYRLTRRHGAGHLEAILTSIIGRPAARACGLLNVLRPVLALLEAGCDTRINGQGTRIHRPRRI